MVKKYSSNAQELYKTDPEFREKHLAKLKEKIECECGKKISRANMKQHKSTNAHKVAMGEVLPKKIQKNIDYFKDLKEKMKRMDKTGWDKEYDKALDLGVKAIDVIVSKISKQ